MALTFGIMFCILSQFIYEPMVSFISKNITDIHLAGRFYLFTSYLRMLFVVDK